MTTFTDAPTDMRMQGERLAVDSFAAATEGQSAIFEQAMMAPVELTRFCAHRMSRDLETMQAIGRCRTPAELITVWTEAAQTAAEDYREEMTRMMGIMASGALRPVQNGAVKPKRRPS